MSRMTQVIPDLLGGVSQKPDAEKAYNEVRRLDNALLSRTDGVRKRPATEHINVIDNDISDIPSKPFIHTVKRGPNDIYTIAVMNGELFIYDSLTGDQKQVLTPHGMEYLLSVNGFRAATIGDTTVIVNRDVVVRQEETRAQQQPHEALVYVKAASYSNTYKIDFGAGYVVNYTTANVSDENASKTLSTEDVAIGIYGALVTNAYFNLYFTATFYGSAILIKRADGQDFSIQVTDSQAGQGFILIKNEVQRFEDLPNRARDGMVVKVAGNPVSDKDDYWVQFQLINKLNEAVGGVWREVPAPSSSFGFKRETMPWAIKRFGSMIGTRKVVQDQLAPLVEYRGDTVVTKGFDSSDPSNLFYISNDAQETDEVVLTAADIGLGDGVAYVNFDVDGTTIGPGESFTVTLLVDHGFGYLGQDELLFFDGDRKWNQSLRTEIQGWSVGDKVKISLHCFDAAGLPSSAIHPKVFVHAGTHPEFPGFKIMYGPHWYVEYPQNIYTDTHTEYLRVAMFDPAIQTTGYHLEVGITVSGTWSANTLGTNMRVALVGVASISMPDLNIVDVGGSSFKIYLEAEPDRTPWFGSHPNGARSLIGGFFYVTREVNPSVQVCYIDTTPADGFYTGGGFGTDELAGMTLKNLTDGSEGTITTNSDNMIMVLGLSGGIRNRFEPGDIVEVSGSISEYFLFDRIDWTNRLAGSDESVPGPSIINRTLSEVFFYKNRLGLCSGEIVNLSAAGDLFRFYRRTATDLLDDDPIDITSSHQDVAAFDAAVNWREKLYLFSNAGHQFVLGGEPNLTAKTVFIQHIGSHQCSLDTRPMTAGDRLFFIRNTFGYSRVMEMVLDQNGMALAFDLTKNVPQYIKGNVIDMAGDQNVGCLFFLTDDMTHNNLFVYNYERDSSGQDLLAAWGKWTFGETDGDPTHTTPQILTIDMVDGYLYMAITRKGIPVYGGEGVMLERINLTTPTDATNLHWDRLGLDNIASGYSMYIELPTLYPRDSNGRNITDGILKLQYLNVDYHKAGLLRVGTYNRGRPYENSVFSGGANTQGRLRTSLIGLNTQVAVSLSCEHQNGIGFTSLSWDGDYHKSRK